MNIEKVCNGNEIVLKVTGRLDTTTAPSLETAAAEAVAAVMALKEGIVPPTINLDEVDPECDLDYTPNVPVKADLTIALSDSLGFGGHNSCVAFRKYIG